MILVTGGTGFIGAYLLRQLAGRGEQVRAIRRPLSKMEMVANIPGIEWVEADVLNVPQMEDAMQGVKKIYHAAAIVSYDKRQRQRMIKVNVQGTANVVNLALHHQVEKMVFVSSIAALGRKAKKQKITEKAVWETSQYNTQYGISKFRAEREVWRGIAEGLDAVIVNPSVVLGAGYWKDSSVKIFHQLNKGWPFYPRGKTGYVDVRDVARAMVDLMESNIKNERFILSSEDWDYKSLFSSITDNLGKGRPKVKINRRVALAGYRIFGIGNPLITRDLVINVGNEFCYDASKVQKAIDLKFTPIQQTIKETSEALKLAVKEEKNFGWLPQQPLR